MNKRSLLGPAFEKFDAFIAISSHLRDYRLAYLINQSLGFTLEKSDDLPAYNARSEKACYYSCYTFDDRDRQLQHFLLANPGNEGLLVPTQKEAGYFLMIRGLMSTDMVELIMGQLKMIPNVLTVFSIDQTKIPNIELLLSDVELHEINLKRKAKTNFKTSQK